MFIRFLAKWFTVGTLLVAFASLAFLTGCADDLLGLGEVARQKTYQDQIQASAAIGAANAQRDAEIGKAQAVVDKERVLAEAQLERERLRQESLALQARLTQEQENAAQRRFQENLILFEMVTTGNPLVVAFTVIAAIIVGGLIAARINGYTVGIRREG